MKKFTPTLSYSFGKYWSKTKADFEPNFVFTLGSTCGDFIYIGDRFLFVEIKYTILYHNQAFPREVIIL